MRSYFLTVISVSALSISIALGTTRYVDIGSLNPSTPYTNWNSAALTIQDAVDASIAGDEILVTNGLYEAGGRPAAGKMTNRVAIDKPLSVRSVNGPAVTTIKGIQIPGQVMNTNAFKSVRCAYVTNGAILSGFSLTNGGVWIQSPDGRDQSGAGAWCESSGTLSNCVIQGNAAFFAGGGINQGICLNCTIVSNSAWYYGGGASGCVLNGCILAGNQQTSTTFGGGGGAYSCALTNCGISNNYSATVDSSSIGLGGGGAYLCSLDHCTLSQNLASTAGGGANGGTLKDCLVSSNFANIWGGGTSGSEVDGCTLVGNTARSGGGGARFGTISNSVLSYNSSQNFGRGGGGACEATVINCLLIANNAFLGGGLYFGFAINCAFASNSAPGAGGAVYSASVTNCTIVANTGGNGGGAYSSTLANSIVYFNSAPTAPDYDAGCSFAYSCVSPLPTNGPGNISGPPCFVDPSLADLHLAPNSPCVNVGTNGWVYTALDLAGSPRISGGTVDMGAYEEPTPWPGNFFSWLQSYGLATDGSANSSDPDGDGMSNYQEWMAGTNPTNGASVLRVTEISSFEQGFRLTWQSADIRSYSVQRSSSFSSGPNTFTTIASNLPGSTGSTSYFDTNGVSPGPWFYRISVP